MLTEEPGKPEVYSIAQQLDGCTVAIMNPIEGEQEPGGQPFKAVQKAISTVPPLFVCACVCVFERRMHMGLYN